MMKGWETTLITIAILFGIFLLYRLLLLWAVSAYQKLIKNNTVNVDRWVHDPQPSPQSCLKVVILHTFNTIGFKGSPEAVELEPMESDKVEGLKVTEKKAGNGTEDNGKKKTLPLVVGTIRMGFGHHRIAYATTSWGLGADGDRETYFHDLLNIKSPEAKQIHDIDQKYSKMSRLASELGGIVEQFWGKLTKSGDEDSLRVTYQWGELLKPVLMGLDKNSPFIASHSLVAHAAVACGFKNVINLVIDNHAQWFVVVPGALNLVQGPSNYHNFLKMGVPPEELQLAGHWIPKDLVEGIPDACQRRIERAQSVPRKPLRLLIPVGGAGAQRKFVTSLVRAVAPFVKKGQVQLFLNAGDHAHMKAAFIEALDDKHLPFDSVTDMISLRAFKDSLLAGNEPPSAVTLFTYTDYFTAVATTDILCNVADVLACKPSELAFYPIPKLMIRRVGDHEAYSALRASELGEGTLEARTLDVCLRYIDLFLEPDLLTQMNQAIVNNNSIGVYDGCKNAVRIALERANANKKDP